VQSATTFSDSGLAASTSYSYRVKATDAAGNWSAYSNVASATTPTPDTTPPTAPSALTATAQTASQINLSWTASTDNVAVTGYQVERCQGAGCTSFAADGPVQSATTFSDSGLAASTSYSYRVKATDAAGNWSAYSNVASATTAAAPSGLVAAYAFGEGSGTTTADATGNGHTGTLLGGATFTASGKYGGGLSLNGSTAYVDLGNAADLQITGSMTWSAWVYATANPADDGQIVAKSNGTGWQFKTSPDTGSRTFGVGVSPNSSSITQRYSNTVRQLGTWYHVAGVYNAAAATLDIYVNGVLDNGLLRGTIPTSQYNNASEHVVIGRRTGGYYFQGTIDELRLYNRALSQAEIQTDMNTAIAP
jgi:chitodextrinase